MIRTLILLAVASLNFVGPNCNAQVAADSRVSDMKKNTVRYGEFLYDLAARESSFVAKIDAGDESPELVWELVVQAAENRDYEGNQDAPSHAPRITAHFKSRRVRGWRGLVGKKFKLSPGKTSSASVYTAFHEFAEEYTIEIIDKRADELLIRGDWDVREGVEAYGWVPVTGVLVRVDEELFRSRMLALAPPPGATELPPGPSRDSLYADMFAHARQAIGDYIEGEQLGPPKVKDIWYVWFPTQSQRSR